MPAPVRQWLNGKVALVTGAASGIGKGCALRLASDGASIVIADRNLKGAEETLSQIVENGGNARIQQLEVRDEQQCREAVEFACASFDGLDILVNNAGIYPRATLEQTDESLWDEILGVNLKGPFFLCKYAVPAMRQRGGGSIINIGSVHGLGGAEKLAAYSISKGGLLTMTKNLAVSLANDRIRVNYLIPGWVLSQTEIATQKREGHGAEWLAQKGAQLAMGRFQTPDDAARVIAFLASDDSLMVTGCVLNSDAGYSIRCIGAEDV